MLSEIQKILEGLEDKRKELLSQLDSMSTDTLTFKAGPDKWSIVEVVEHLVINPEFKNDQVYRHPYGGPLDMSETLHFFDVHFDNHMRHIDRILAQTNR